MRYTLLSKLSIIFSIIVFVFYYLSNYKFIRFERSSFYTLKNLSIDSKCPKLFTNELDEASINETERWSYSKDDSFTDEQYNDKIKINCELFLKESEYFLSTNHDEGERQFSIAFTIITFKSMKQTERLLRMIYRPWNYYCIHVDKKSEGEFYEAINQLVTCLNDSYGNIVNTRNRVDVKWGYMSVLTADLNCMREIYQRYKSWKYVINLTGQEFPLKTNKELVQILKAYNGANNLEGTYKRRNEDRVPKVKMPFPLVWYKGSVHITANYDFVKFIFESPKSQVILKALNGSWVPDEQFFATLNFNPHFRIPGSFIGDLDDGAPDGQHLHYFLTRFKNWGEYTCLSKKRVRGICIWGVRDLPKLVHAKHLFANKFYEEFQPATLRCLEQWYYEKLKKEQLSPKIDLDLNYYKSRIFVVNQFQPLHSQ